MNCDQSLLRSTRSFWNANPCDGQVDVFKRMEFRYGKEPWLPSWLDRVAQHSSVLEVGCGQGTDALYCCQRMGKDGTYVALDYSDQSLARARQSTTEFREHLSTVPQHVLGNAESLDFADNHFECVVSTGVLHHTPDTQKSIDEVYRVLDKGGTAYVSLYRRISPKVFAAHAIRLFARFVDKLAGREKYLYSFCQRLGSDHFLGTMLLECLGVPILRSYTRRQMLRMFSRFESVKVYPAGIGISLGMARFLDKGWNPLGALWLIEAKKPGHLSEQ